MSEEVVKCNNCDKPSTMKTYNSLYFCNDHGMDFYRSGDVNKKLNENMEKMMSMGVKRGSFDWVRGNLQGLANVVGKKRIRIDWLHEYKEIGIFGVIREFIIFYFFVK